VDAAQKGYADILEQNKNVLGLKKLHEIGHQALLHTDNENFLMIIAQKDNRIVRLKVNKLTSMTSLKELQDISKIITAAP
jgi:5-methylcytosine-specific restriction endonuclease McrBC regulatory subunit McrC